MYQSGVDELYHPLREESMSPHHIFEFQAIEEETTAFENENEQQIYRFPVPSPDFTSDSSPEDLGEFLKRPTLIKTISWVPAGVVDADFDPWSLFLATTVIKNKIQNFAYFRGNMHIKVVVNASPFYYGAMLINYTPIPTYVKSIDNAYVSALLPQSQKPHIWIDLRTNCGGEMILPFVFPNNYARVTNAADVALLGRMRNITYVGLQSANGAAINGVTVKIYAWMEDVELTGNTTELALQAKKGVADEYGNGPISRPATALANWASYLVNVPVIGTYAKATQIGASAVSSVAGLFGWSKVPVIENVRPVKPLFFHDLASAHLSEPISKVLLDPKGELSVDPRIVCSHTGEDEMSIANIVQKDSFLTSVIWATNDAPDTLLFSSAVNPTLHVRESGPGGYIIGSTPMAHIAEMFKEWRGDIIFTFRFICSQYHRGRVRIHWDPVKCTTTTDVSNITLTKIVDIGETTEVEFRIPYVQHRSWTQCGVLNDASKHSIAGLITPTLHSDNGALIVRVLNNLSAPIDVASVTMMVFVKGAENLEFANPREISYRYSPFEPQGLIEDAETDTQQKSTPLNTRYLINYGEAIPSLRVLLQRASLYQDCDLASLYNQSATPKLQRFIMYQTRFPCHPGYDQKAPYTAKGVVTPATTYYYNYCQYVPLAWCTQMYVAQRGSIQWHFHLVDRANRTASFTAIRSSHIITTSSQMLIGGFFDLVDGALSGSATYAKNFRNTNGYSPGGIVQTDTGVNPSISIEMPMMTPTRFNVTGPQYLINGTSFDYTYIDTYDITTDLTSDTSLNAQVYIRKLVNAGTDFSLTFFLCTPQLYYSATCGDTPV